MNNLLKNDLIRGLPEMKLKKDGLCDACKKEKEMKASFKLKTRQLTNEPLNYLFGPLNMMSIYKNIYALVIVDE